MEHDIIITEAVLAILPTKILTWPTQIIIFLANPVGLPKLVATCKYNM
jgi:hypothetical protein